MSENRTAAQEEFDHFISKNTGRTDYTDRLHPEDREEAIREREDREDDQTEDDRYRASQIDAAMRMPAFGNSVPLGGDGHVPDIKLPPASFDSGRATGVKGVIADARSYETARRAKWMSRARTARRSVFGGGGGGNITAGSSRKDSNNNDSADSGGEDMDAEEFLQQWRESRQRELEDEARAHVVRTRRTSPSVRLFGRLDEVDALGYLDAIEKVGRETVVAVFVYDHECQVSAAVESALFPLIGKYPAVHFVKVHYEDIEFDNAAVPAILAYKNQGDLFANLTGIIELIPEHEDFDSDSLKRLFQNHGII